jgi:hypothetical protein
MQGIEGNTAIIDQLLPAMITHWQEKLFRRKNTCLSHNLRTRRVFDPVLPIRGKIHVPLAIVHVKTDYDLTRRRSEMLKIGIAGIDIFTSWYTSDADDHPGARIDPRPVGREVHVVDCGVAIMGRKSL